MKNSNGRPIGAFPRGRVAEGASSEEYRCLAISAIIRAMRPTFSINLIFLVLVSAFRVDITDFDC